MRSSFESVTIVHILMDYAHLSTFVSIFPGHKRTPVHLSTFMIIKDNDKSTQVSTVHPHEKSLT